MMLVRPQGLFGIYEIWDFWRKQGREHGRDSGELDSEK
jgi:hypothetical protein